VEAFRPDILLDRSEDPLGHVKRLPPDEQTRRNIVFVAPGCSTNTSASLSYLHTLRQRTDNSQPLVTSARPHYALIATAISFHFKHHIPSKMEGFKDE
jgi:hypothetical protein